MINVDSANVFGETRDIQVAGLGQTTLEDMLQPIASEQQRVIVGEARPEAGVYYRSDHFSFAQRGIPAIFFRGGTDMVDGGQAAGSALLQQRRTRYHTVDDEFDPSWSFAGALQDAQAVTSLVRAVADASDRPKWKEGSEFAQKRPAS